MRYASPFLIVVLSSALLAGCGEEAPTASKPSDTASTETPSSTPVPAEAPGPKVSVDADKTHAVQPGDEITLTVDAQGFDFAPDKIGGANETGVGHYRVYLDNASGDDFLVTSGDTTVKVKLPGDLTDGSHELRVVLHQNDRTPLDPPAESGVLLIVYRLD